MKFLIFNWVAGCLSVVVGVFLDNSDMFLIGIICLIIVSCSVVILEAVEESKKVRAINIILNETDRHNPIFVEIETEHGKSIRVGDRSNGDDGLTKIRITMEDLRG